MTLPAPTYDLVLLLDPQAEQVARAKILADTRAGIEAQGEFLRHDEWGDRTLTYPIDRKAGAEYHLLQFHAGTPELLSALDRTLRITDGVLRFRIIKLKPGVPDAPAMPAAPAVERPTEPEAVVDATVETGDQADVETGDQADVETDTGAEAETDTGAEAEVEVEVGEPA